jgi:predicted membrane channel-forming protein YqfA (hemolysin III family)
MMPPWPRSRGYRDALVVTSVSMLGPAILWYLAGLPVQAALVALGSIASVVYHRRGEPEGLILTVDIILAACALVATLWAFLCEVIEKSTVLPLWLGGVLILSLACDQCFRASGRAVRNRDTFGYETSHLLWHILVLTGQWYLVCGVLAHQT